MPFLRIGPTWWCQAGPGVRLDGAPAVRGKDNRPGYPVRPALKKIDLKDNAAETMLAVGAGALNQYILDTRRYGEAKITCRICLGTHLLEITIHGNF